MVAVSAGNVSSLADESSSDAEDADLWRRFSPSILMRVRAYQGHFHKI